MFCSMINYACLCVFIPYELNLSARVHPHFLLCSCCVFALYTHIQVYELEFKTDAQLRRLPFALGWNVSVPGAVMGKSSMHVVKKYDDVHVVRKKFKASAGMEGAKKVGLKLRFSDTGEDSMIKLGVCVTFHRFASGFVFGSHEHFDSASKTYFL